MRQMSECLRNFCRSSEPRIDRRCCVTKDSAMLFPRVVTREREVRVFFAVRHEEGCSLIHEILIHLLQPLEVMEPLKVLPHGMEDEGSLIFLNGELHFAV